MRKLFQIVLLTLTSCFPLTPGDQTTASLQQLDAIFGDYFAWWETMFDPETGGVFYSAAAQSKPKSYPPHIESTAKYVRVLQWSERLENLPDERRQHLIRFFQTRQIGPPDYPADHTAAGYFLDAAYPDLHPDHPNAPRRKYVVSRALDFSVKSLGLLGSSPLFALPNANRNGEELAHLRSPEDWLSWLKLRRWDRTWYAGSDVLTQIGHIRRIKSETLRQQFVDTTIDYLEREQRNAETGFWGSHDQGDNQRPYYLLNGSHKIVLFHRAFDRPVPDADRLLESSLAEFRAHSPENLLYIYNTSQLVRNLRNQEGVEMGDSDLATFIRQAAMHLARFRQEDGGFSTSLVPERGNRFNPPSKQVVSNTDASGLALKTRNTLHELHSGSYKPLASVNDHRSETEPPLRKD